MSGVNPSLDFVSLSQLHLISDLTSLKLPLSLEYKVHSYHIFVILKDRHPTYTLINCNMIEKIEVLY